jgi:hypothetical protein
MPARASCNHAPLTSAYSCMRGGVADCPNTATCTADPRGDRWCHFCAGAAAAICAIRSCI